MKINGFNLTDAHIPGEYVNEYLHDYAKRFGLTKFMRFNTSVELAVDNGLAGWMLTVAERFKNEETETIIKTSKLIVATGLTSMPFMPNLEGK